MKSTDLPFSSPAHGLGCSVRQSLKGASGVPEGLSVNALASEDSVRHASEDSAVDAVGTSRHPSTCGSLRHGSWNDVVLTAYQQLRCQQGHESVSAQQLSGV